MGFAKFLFFNVMGWRIQGNFDPAIKKAVIIVVPHTSWHDFYIGVFTRRILNIQINFIGKSELFRWPFGAYFRWMGGVPLDRTSGQNKVEAIAEIFSDKEEFRLALAPEGTRKKVLEWKTGYYYIARAANVPIIPVAFDYTTKSVIIHQPFYPTGNIESDSERLRQYYKGVIGKKKEFS
ncbi:acyltransferase [Aequorivita sp. H23M31]|uniref:Acyltransferase n=1 Tax=Aequorivita ciconiae TaxID=2494375 RepID=A0A410G1B6_9FLAO|nr:1-acyl-sn-glycerol-3-phosphate acyltransferase [Aequorivita sp. H23M31]QAA81039.1 acyltransferase [Aequorivita sp. H23M31]